VVEVILLDDQLDEVGRRLLHHAAEVLAVEAAPVDLADVGLGTGDGVFLRIEDAAADLDAAVALAILETDLELQLEVAVGLLAAQEGVVLEGAVGVAADEGMVLDAPVLGEAFPAGEVLAVEE